MNLSTRAILICYVDLQNVEGFVRTSCVNRTDKVSNVLCLDHFVMSHHGHSVHEKLLTVTTILHWQGESFFNKSTREVHSTHVIGLKRIHTPLYPSLVGACAISDMFPNADNVGSSGGVVRRCL